MPKKSDPRRGKGGRRNDGTVQPAKLNEREVKLFQLAMRGDMTLAEMAREAGYKGESLTELGYQALCGIKRKMAAVMEDHGLTPDTVLEMYLKPMLGATEVKVFNDKKNGIVYSDPLVAWGPRGQALDMSFKILGAYAREEKAGDTNITNNTIQIINHIERPKRTIVAGAN